MSDRSRRGFCALFGGALVASALPDRARAAEMIAFDELYGSFGVLGMEFSDKVKTLAGQDVVMRGFMAPPLKAEADFFVLTAIPMAICPFCSSDADWPADIVVVFLERARTFETANRLIEVRGTLEVGSSVDPETGFVSQIRIVDARLRGA